jgi:sec-independent protein translocase protein TatB
MFDIGFGELLVCAIVALLVLGPERLPGTVRTVGRWVGRARHTVNQFTDQIDREIRAEELKRRIDEELKNTGLSDVSRQVKEALHAPLPLVGAGHLRQEALPAPVENTIGLPPSADEPEHADTAAALRSTPPSAADQPEASHAGVVTPAVTPTPAVTASGADATSAGNKSA